MRAHKKEIHPSVVEGPGPSQPEQAPEAPDRRAVGTMEEVVVVSTALDESVVPLMVPEVLDELEELVVWRLLPFRNWRAWC